MLKRCQHAETNLDSEPWAPGWTLPLEKAVFLGILLKGPHGDLREPFERFFAKAKRSEPAAPPGPEIFRKLSGISRNITEARRKSFPSTSTYIPSVLKSNVDQFGVRIVPAGDEVLDLATKTASVEVSHDVERVALLVHRPSTCRNYLPAGRVVSLLNNEPARTFVPLMLGPLVLQQCHADVSCHFGVSKALPLLEALLLVDWGGACARWWIRRCVFGQARKFPRRMVRQPVIGIALPDGPG